MATSRNEIKIFHIKILKVLISHKQDSNILTSEKQKKIKIDTITFFQCLGFTGCIIMHDGLTDTHPLDIGLALIFGKPIKNRQRERVREGGREGGRER